MGSKIPKSIQIMGRTIKIRWDEGLHHDCDANGLAVFRDDEIVLHKSTNGAFITDNAIRETLLHEVTHWIFHMIGEHSLRDNEKLVSLFSRCLHQVFRDAKYD